MTNAPALNPRQLAHLRAVVAQPTGLALRAGDPWYRATFAFLANLDLVRIERRAGIRRIGDGLYPVEETWVIATARGIAAAR